MSHIDRRIPIIDLFAGPGGLGEGFSAFTAERTPRFRIALSIEKDSIAHETLELRSFYRQFAPKVVPDDYYDHLRGTISRQVLFRLHPTEAAKAAEEAWLLELRKETAGDAKKRIATALGKADPWVLIGGPPCQAYSLIGRSRNKDRDDAEYIRTRNQREKLYVEYLQVIADHGPAVFVMENVKGLLSATHAKEGIFDRILDDLATPADALKREGRSVSEGRSFKYQLYSLNPHATLFPKDTTTAGDYVIRSERHGIPQSRHRIIVVGVRSDIGRSPACLVVQDPIPAWKVLKGLPKVRSGLSQEADTPDAWRTAMRTALDQRWLREHDMPGGVDVRKLIEKTIRGLRFPRAGRGAEFIECRPTSAHERKWFVDKRLRGICNHSTRGHMASDLRRYLYAACYGKVHTRSPELSDFPAALHPDHQNVDDALNGGHFADRFRVQLRGRPSTTVTSHIAKDGHYYIHYDPSQCRSLTVREAARLQTFPDNYLFCGGRTAQYGQVGNAVPPLLARQIAEVVFQLLR